MISHNNYNLGANEGFVIFRTSKLISSFIDGFTVKMKSQPNPMLQFPYLLNEFKHIYWILDLEGEVHLIWGFVDQWSSRMQGQWVFWVGNNFQLGPKNFDFLDGPESTSPEKFIGGGGFRPP